MKTNSCRNIVWNNGKPSSCCNETGFQKIYFRWFECYAILWLGGENSIWWYFGLKNMLSGFRIFTKNLVRKPSKETKLFSTIFHFQKPLFIYYYRIKKETESIGKIGKGGTFLEIASWCMCIKTLTTIIILMLSFLRAEVEVLRSWKAPDISTKCPRENLL